MSRNFLENIYMTFIMPLLEYSCEVWDSCTVADAGRFEQLQLETAIIVTGLPAYEIFSNKFLDILNLIFLRICLDALTTLFICLDHFPSALRVTLRYL
jgi:hypothetical protein